MNDYTIVQCANIIWQTVTTKSGYLDWQRGRCSRYMKEYSDHKGYLSSIAGRRWSLQDDKAYCPSCSGLSREVQDKQGDRQ